ncbi:60S ribosomal subunit biogenesis protein Nop16, putative [Talaromyces stipitatus ATCC 10500]|uniref:Nucleolar protein 16 n=1 Tax=Talaromyces stipitatus (strain ATCC 10500 / CBS 375.48 / QM 6759 / NRRL 1006) TaxID=441959 RepID=B8M5C0_TALSN|nr:66S preribosome component NOP16 [Talaromyces stipitatus ATCC 10500]EED19726.1 60S ribosomal subunit biogenesis protein Nop16, putative [Talaromyces stipitatus ATCC 10500]
MGRELQKRKNRAKVPKLKKKRKLLRNGDKKINVLGNALIAENWNKNETLIQNYRRLGLTTRLNAPTGGVERPKGVDALTADKLTSDSLHITGTKNPNATTLFDPEEVQVERDPETGKILRVITNNEEDDEIEVAGRKVKRSNPLSDPINDIENGVKSLHKKAGLDTGSSSSASEFVRQLEMRALQEEEAVKKRRPRQQSKREEEWVERLVARHGDDIKAMVRDKKLNPMQQSEGDIRRRVRIWKERRSA